MELDEFWAVVAAARSDVDGVSGEDGAVLAKSLRDRLAGLAPARRADFGRHYAALSAEAATWDLFGAAYLIGGGCDIDGFADFRYGLVALGRDWYARALADPDSLAGHPVVAEAAEWDDDSAIFAELVGAAVAEACAVPLSSGGGLSGTEFDVDDDQAVLVRLPRLAALFLG